MVRSINTDGNLHLVPSGGSDKVVARYQLKLDALQMDLATLSVHQPNQNLVLQANGNGKVVISENSQLAAGGVLFDGDTISTDSNANLDLSATGDGRVLFSALDIS